MMNGADRNSSLNVHGTSGSTGVIGETGDGIAIDRSGEQGEGGRPGIVIAVSSLYRLPMNFLRLMVPSVECNPDEILFIHIRITQYTTPYISFRGRPKLIARKKKSMGIM
jgi:hypothetical protein